MFDVAHPPLCAECLWTHGARGALDRLRNDLANFEADPTDLSRLLTRSRKRAIHLPSLQDVASAAVEDLASEEAFDDGAWLVDVMPPAWDGIPFELLDLASFGTAISDLDQESAVSDDDGDKDDDDDVTYADEQGATVHWWGRRASGFAFSPGGDLSAVWYDKLLEERAAGKRWMKAIHAAGGWRLGMPLTRIETRFRRGALRELAAHTAAPGEVRARWFDDPWECLAHLQELWALFTGLPPEADIAPDVTHRGWMRLAVPAADDANRSRWPTDPTWATVQRARFHPDASPTALTRLPHVRHDLEQIDAELCGLFKLRTALRGEYLDTTATLSQELRAFVEQMDEVDAKRGRDFAEEVREKARMLGKPLPARADPLLLGAVSRREGAA